MTKRPDSYSSRSPLPTGANRPVRGHWTGLKQRGVLAVNSIIYIVGLVVVVVAVLSFFGLR
jgi:hypothetical protein